MFSRFVQEMRQFVCLPKYSAGNGLELDLVITFSHLSKRGFTTYSIPHLNSRYAILIPFNINNI